METVDSLVEKYAAAMPTHPRAPAVFPTVPVLKVGQLHDTVVQLCRDEGYVFEGDEITLKVACEILEQFCQRLGVT